LVAGVKAELENWLLHSPIYVTHNCNVLLIGHSIAVLYIPYAVPRNSDEMYLGIAVVWI
jgi:hypothetical protein